MQQHTGKAAWGRQQRWQDRAVALWKRGVATYWRHFARHATLEAGWL